jgi:hypothetical protein
LRRNRRQHFEKIGKNCKINSVIGTTKKPGFYIAGSDQKSPVIEMSKSGPPRKKDRHSRQKIEK